MGHRKSRGDGYRVSYSNTLKDCSTRHSLEGTLGGIVSGTRPNGKTEYETLNFQPIVNFRICLQPITSNKEIRMRGKHG